MISGFLNGLWIRFENNLKKYLQGNKDSDTF